MPTRSQLVTLTVTAMSRRRRMLKAMYMAGKSIAMSLTSSITPPVQQHHGIKVELVVCKSDTWCCLLMWLVLQWHSLTSSTTPPDK